MPATNVGTPLSSGRDLLNVLTPRFVEHFATWMSTQQALGADAHEALPYVEKLSPTDTATDTVNFVLGFFRPGLSVTPVVEVADPLGGLSLAITEDKPLADVEFKRLSRLLGVVLIKMLADSTGLIVIHEDGTDCGAFILNPETTQRDASARPARRAERCDDEGHPRTERMLRALRDMRDLRERRQARTWQPVGF